jgi:hypothetical protein
MILFLDFDGVLHSELAPEADLFGLLPRLEAILRDFPDVQIVISSSWREHNSLDDLRAKFSPDIAPRIIGVTPVIPRVKQVAACREREILAWLESAGKKGEHWLALDDTEWQFKDHRDHLILCARHRGLDAAVEVALRAGLQPAPTP